MQATLDAFGAAIVAGDTSRLDQLVDAAATPAFRHRVHTDAANLSAAGVIADPAPSTRTSTTPATSHTTATSETTPTSKTTATSATAANPQERGKRLQLKKFRYQLAPTEEAETLVPAQLQSRLDAAGSSDSWVAPVELHYALGGSSLPGVDEPEIVLATQFVLARYGDDWTVVGDGAAIGGSPAPTTVWDFPGLAADDTRTAGGESVIASYPGTATTVGHLRGLLPGAVASVSAFWGDDWPRRAVVVATARPTEFRGLTASSATDITGAAAATVFTGVDTEQHTAVGQRIVLTPSAGDLPEPALGVVLRHELTHVAARTVTDPSAPLWITEGVAEYVGRKGTYTRFDDAAPDLAEQIRADTLPMALPANRDFAVDSAQAKVSYQAAWSLAAYVAQKYGEDGLKKLYTGVAASGDAKRQDPAITEVTGRTRAQFIADWRDWLTKQAQ